MGKRSPTKVASNGNAETNGDDVTTKKPKFEVNELLTKVDELTEEFNYDLALKFCEKALQIEPENIQVLETIGNVCSELGDIDHAKQYLLKAVDLQPDKGHVKYLYLGQISEGSAAVNYYKTAVTLMTTAVNESPEDNNKTPVSKREISNVYCSLAELYMTDCCMEEDAEKLCETCCQQAVQMDEENPEAHLVMCNFLLTKGDVESAKSMAGKLFDVWKSLTEKDDDNIVELMSYESRMTLIKVLIEVDLCENVLPIGVQLIEENEDDIRTWYYIGLSKSLLNDNDGQRYYIETALHLYEKNQLVDEDMYSHLQELLGNCPPAEDDIVEDENVSDSDNKNGMDVDG